MKTSDFRKRINSSWIGFNPKEVEAAHVANGLYLETTGEQYLAESVNKLAVIATKKGTIKDHQTEVLLQDASTPFETKNIEVINLFRQHVRQHVAADGAVFDRQSRIGCAYSAAHINLVTEDRYGGQPNDGWAGNLVGLLLKTDFGQGGSPLSSKLRQALADSTDPLSVMLSPFLDTEKKDFTDRYNDLPSDHYESLLHSIPNVKSLRDRLDTFSQYYPNYLSRQRFTRLMIILSLVSLMRYLVLLTENWLQAESVPFLLDTGQTSSRLRSASQLSYIRNIVSFKELYVRLVAQYIFDQTGVQNPSHKEVRDACQRVTRELEEELLKKNPFEISDDVSSDDLIWRAARHIVDVFFDAKEGNFLANFFRSAGIRCGVLMPRGNYQRKHFYLQPDTLTALTLACIPPDSPPITMFEFVDRLQRHYGILIGGGLDDMEKLHRVMIRDLNEDDLQANYNAFTRIMVGLGLAQQRSDGLVLIAPPKF